MDTEGVVFFTSQIASLLKTTLKALEASRNQEAYELKQ